MFDLKGRTAIVTGAGGGIGRAISQSLAARGANLALADIDEAAVAETAATIARSGRAAVVKVTAHRLDVANADAIKAFPQIVASAHAGVDILVNNAGVALGGTFEEIDEADFEWLFAINFWGVVRMTRAFLPVLRQAPEARLVNLSSLFGLVAPPGQSAYAAAKFAVRGFSESLRHELADGPVGVTVVHPGGVKTSIAKNARAPSTADAEEARRQREAFQKKLKLSPEAAGEIIVKAIEQRRARVLVGSDARFVSAVERIAPVRHWSILKKLM